MEIIKERLKDVNNKNAAQKVKYSLIYNPLIDYSEKEMFLFMKFKKLLLEIADLDLIKKRSELK